MGWESEEEIGFLGVLFVDKSPFVRDKSDGPFVTLFSSSVGAFCHVVK